MPRKIEISHKTIIFTIVVVLGLWFLYFIRDILLLFFVALLIAAILDPFVARLAKLRVPRGLSILLTYIIFFGLIGMSIAGLVPPLVEQSTILANNIPALFSKIGGSSVYGEQILREFLSLFSSLPTQIAKFTVSVFSNIISVFTVFIVAFYLLLSRDKLDKTSEAFLGKKTSVEVARVLRQIETKLGGWVLGQGSLMFLVGITSYIGLVLLGIPFALPLAIFAAFLEMVPYIGPLISAIPAVIIGLSISPVMGLAAAALYFLVQQVENYVFVPKVMEKTVGITPVATLLALAVGFKVAGVVGVIMSVPVVITLQIVAKEYFASKS